MAKYTNIMHLPNTPKLLLYWTRAVRIRFLLASVIAVSNGLGIAFWKTGEVDYLSAILTYIGVICLHVSVDLLNDYWDYKRGIDLITKRTKFSGGTGVLPEKLLKPESVYRAGIIFLVLGTVVGAYFVVVRGPTIAAILGFAIVSIYFYSTKIVNAGIDEFFVALKGMLIVIGTVYVQTAQIGTAAIYTGVLVGMLSAIVLLVNSFPDYEADKTKGRKTLVIVLGKRSTAKLSVILFIIIYTLVVSGIIFNYTKIYSLLTFLSLPFAYSAAKNLVRYDWSNQMMERIMASTVTFSRVTGFLLALSLFL